MVLVLLEVHCELMGCFLDTFRIMEISYSEIDNLPHCYLAFPKLENDKELIISGYYIWGQLILDRI